MVYSLKNAFIYLLLSFIAGIPLSIQGMERGEIELPGQVTTDLNKLSDQDIHRLAIAAAPQLRFHPSERYYPTSIEFLCQHSALKKREADGTVITVIPKPVPVSALQKYPTKDYPNGFDELNNYFLDPDKDMCTRRGVPLVGIGKPFPKDYLPPTCEPHTFSYKEAKVNAPVYYHAQKRVNNPGIVIQYIFLFVHQGKLIPESKATALLDVGMHEADLEHLDVYLTPKDGKWFIEQVYFSAHGSKPWGEMLWANEVSFVEETHVVGYDAKFGHAVHSKNIGFDIGRTFDTTAEDGPRWNCWQVSLINLGDRENPAPGQEWILFGGRLGGSKESSRDKIGRFFMEGSTLYNDSPAGPAVDNWWWRTQEQLFRLTRPSIKVTAGSGRRSDYFDWSDVIPVRMRKIKWEIQHPQADDIQFTVNEYRYSPRSDRKNVYGIITNDKITNAFHEGTLVNLYITDVKSISGKKIQGPIEVNIWGFEE